MSNDWIEHNGGPQPVDDNVWVEVNDRVEGYFVDLAQGVDWKEAQGYRILNKHLIDAALKRGIRLGLNAAMASLLKRPNGYKEAGALLVLTPDAIAREAVLDQLTSEAQADNMGYDND